MCFPDIYNLLSSSEYVYFNMQMRFLHIRQTKRSIRNNTAWGILQTEYLFRFVTLIQRQNLKRIYSQSQKERNYR